jgi:hypothetical protein
MPTFLTGYKSYLIAGIAALIGIDQGLIQAGFQVPAVPGFVIMLLGAAGLYSVRSGISTDTAKATADIMAQVTTIPPPPAVVAASASKTMTPKANGTPYASFIAAGWTDVELVSNGYMSPTP